MLAVIFGWVAVHEILVTNAALDLRFVTPATLVQLKCGYGPCDVSGTP
jgi:hypothetical protein